MSGAKIIPISTASINVGSIPEVSDCVTAADGAEAHLSQREVLWMVFVRDE